MESHKIHFHILFLNTLPILSIVHKLKHIWLSMTRLAFASHYEPVCIRDGQFHHTRHFPFQCTVTIDTQHPAFHLQSQTTSASHSGSSLEESWPWSSAFGSDPHLFAWHRRRCQEVHVSAAETISWLRQRVISVVVSFQGPQRLNSRVCLESQLSPGSAWPSPFALSEQKYMAALLTWGETKLPRGYISIKQLELDNYVMHPYGSS